MILVTVKEIVLFHSVEALREQLWFHPLLINPEDFTIFAVATLNQMTDEGVEKQIVFSLPHWLSFNPPFFISALTILTKVP